MVFFIAAGSAGCFFFGMMSYEKGDFGRIVVPVFESNFNIPVNYAKSLSVKADRIDLDVKHMNYMKLCYKRSQALREGILHPLPDDWVPARIRWNNKNVRVDVRLKGNYEDNWGYAFKWAFQVKVKDNETVMGLSKFTLKHPRTRGFFVDWFFYGMLKFFDDNMAIKLQFAHCAINGRDLGIYLVEEQFSQELVANNNRPPSAIFKIWNRWQYYNADSSGGFSNEVLNEQHTISPPYPFRSNRQKKDEYLFSNFKKAKNLYEAFKRKKIKTHEAFDSGKLAAELAILDLFGYQHASAYANMGLYYNPVSNRIEPVGYDEGEIYPVECLLGEFMQVREGAFLNTSYVPDPVHYQIWYDNFFQDTVFFKDYIKVLQAVSKKEFLDSFFLSVDSVYQRELKIIHKTFPAYRFEEKRILYENQVLIRRIIDQPDAVHICAKKIDPSSRMLHIDMTTTGSLPIRIIGMTLGEKSLIKVSGPSLVNGREVTAAANSHQFAFKVPDSVDWPDNISGNLVFNYTVLGTDSIKTTAIYGKRF